MVACRGWSSLVLLGVMACTTSPGVTLTTKRLGHTSEVIGPYLYVFGGGLANVERSRVNSDGTLEPFELVSGVALAIDHTAHTSAVIGNYVYVFGGVTGNSITASTSVERASIDADGSLEPFATAGTALATARLAFATAVTDSHVYAIGGAPDSNSGLVNTVEQATINGDGSLGPFVTLAGVALATPRRNFEAAIVGTHIYVFGGTGTNGDLDSIERATINADGSLSTFDTVPNLTLVHAGLDHTLTAIGNRLYVVGGLHGALVPSPEIAVATVDANDNLGLFTTVSGVTLATARGSHASVVVGNHVYVLGGLGERGILTSVEQATIAPDGSLQAFDTL